MTLELNEPTIACGIALVCFGILSYYGRRVWVYFGSNTWKRRKTLFLVLTGATGICAITYAINYWVMGTVDFQSEGMTPCYIAIPLTVIATVLLIVCPDD